MNFFYVITLKRIDHFNFMLDCGQNNFIKSVLFDKHSNTACNFCII